ncbi:Transcription factor C subunit 7-like protein [Cladobotryum mycophilum]|uniref:Transcription factor C subunit 7-like protein n=1 Tax=Cladobotryum mycophilum TaxID=491253 RepID=A0ABR0SDJ6_9HYPO
MPLETIYVVRHGFRSGWSVDPVTGTYSSSFPSPTGIPVDPALTAHGVEQANELGHHLMTLDPPVEAVYSSPYYRCLQTITPFVELQTQRRAQLSEASQDAVAVGGVSDIDKAAAAVTTIRPEYGLCEWFGSAPFEHPGPAPPTLLKSMFPAWDETYAPTLYPSTRGETLAQLEQRLTETMQSIIDQCDSQGRRAVVLCTHAAVVIMLGRILTGQFPESVDVDDFHAFTCGLSVYRRGPLPTTVSRNSATSPVGSWACEANSDCSFLSGGAERGWRFVGDEEFPGTGSMSQASAHKL